MNEWDARYNVPHYVYGTSPNHFFKSFLENYRPKNILLPGEGEGRNAVFAAQNGVEVTAFDSSVVAQQKALDLAKSFNTTIDYRISEYLTFSSDQKFDSAGLIFNHMKSEFRKKFHQIITGFLNKNGLIVLFGYHKDQINYRTGGPLDADMLFSVEEIMEDFNSLKIILLEKEITNLKEGDLHKGKSAVVKMIAQKIA